MKKKLTQCEIIVQGREEEAASYRDTLNKCMKEICSKKNVNDGVTMLQTAAPNGRMTTTLLWNEISTGTTRRPKQKK